jgi:hypothetical protein
MVLIARRFEREEEKQVRVDLPLSVHQACADFRQFECALS